jgi:hypothetical protein
MSEDVANMLLCNIPHLGVRAFDYLAKIICREGRTRIIADPCPVARYLPSGEKAILHMRSLSGGSFVDESSARVLSSEYNEVIQST